VLKYHLKELPDEKHFEKISPTRDCRSTARKRQNSFENVEVQQPNFEGHVTPTRMNIKNLSG